MSADVSSLSLDMGDSPLGQPYDYAVSRLDAVGGDMEALPIPLQTLLLIESAQGMIDNGGLDYFYEADFPNQPPYSLFVEAYRRIGAERAASCIEASSFMFPFAEPHFFQPLREIWLEKMRADPKAEFAKLSGQVSGDESVWTQLADYVQKNRDAFTPGGSAGARP